MTIQDEQNNFHFVIEDCKRYFGQWDMAGPFGPEGGGVMVEKVADDQQSAGGAPFTMTTSKRLSPPDIDGRLLARSTR
jgi:hypothetical protein